ncbi:MAG: CIA30 family protein [Polaribacter sp.]|uniref:CIA30 family protein n=1 Tax=Polaribacter sp. TaxID=1920175 RepID=UPI00326379FA
MNNDTILFDESNKNNNWFTVNDTVMGGISSSKSLITEKGNLIFFGDVSIENNGGFTMIKMPLNIDFSDKNSQLIIKLKGDGKKYQFRIKSKIDQKYWYIQSFQTQKEIEEITLNLLDFYPSFRGCKLNKENFSGNTIKEIAIFIGNKKNEKFALEIEKIYIK